MSAAQAPEPARPEVRLLPVDEIDAGALPRDRLAAGAEAMDELRGSILARGLRQPIEVYEFARPVEGRGGPTLRWGLISGARRLAAFRALRADGLAGFASIPAFLREPDSQAAALLAMVEENEIRAGLSAWERGRIVVEARDAGVFATLDAAVDGLYPAASKAKRLRLRHLATLVEELDGCLHAPEALSQRHALRLAEACQRGYGDLIRATLRSLPHAQRPADWDALAPILREMETAPEPSAAPPRPGRPRRLSAPRSGLVIRREKTRTGYALHFNGPDATELLLDAVFDAIDRLFAPA